MKTELKIAFLQMNSIDDKMTNLRQFKKLCSEITPGSVDLIISPENTFFYRIRKSNLTLKDCISIDDEIIGDVKKLSDSLDASILIGATPTNDDGKIFNASIWVSPGGVADIVYKKIHLFDVDVGETSVRESDQFVAGSEVSSRNFKGWKIGFSICYDLRFGELYQILNDPPVDLILVPAAFLPQTGQAHWHTLLRARAIEFQSYVVAPAQSGIHKGVNQETRSSYGHSLAVDPWGRVLVDLEQKGPFVGIVSLSKLDLSTVRASIPMNSHRKLRHLPS